MKPTEKKLNLYYPVAFPSGFVVKLATHFRISDAEVHTEISHVRSEANADMVLRLAEMSHHIL